MWFPFNKHTICKVSYLSSMPNVTVSTPSSYNLHRADNYTRLSRHYNTREQTAPLVVVNHKLIHNTINYKITGRVLLRTLPRLHN